MDTRTSLACPSARAKAGASLLGVKQQDGTLAILPQLLPVDQAFMEEVSKSPLLPEQRFRFTSKCITKGCKQWDGTRCQVASRVMQYLEELPQTTALVPCAIRSTCRWFYQSGADACRICPYIVTEIPEEEIRRESNVSNL